MVVIAADLQVAISLVPACVLYRHALVAGVVGRRFLLLTAKHAYNRILEYSIKYLIDYSIGKLLDSSSSRPICRLICQ